MVCYNLVKNALWKKEEHNHAITCVQTAATQISLPQTVSIPPACLLPLFSKPVLNSQAFLAKVAVLVFLISYVR